jgi:cation:H+ antiporter
VATLDLLRFLAGLAGLAAGGELLVRGAAALAARAGISPLVIGLTVVSFGTSAPELVVSVVAAGGGRPEIAVGNVVGSNIFNVLVVLGLCALLRPLAVAQQLIERDVPLMVAASVIFWLFGLDGRLSRLEGGIFLAGLVAFTWFVVHAARAEAAGVRAEYDRELAPRARISTPRALVVTAAGLALLVVGGRWLVAAATSMAQALGVDDAVIALTVVAVGTSLPEVATSVVATLRGHRDIAVGNAIGSNLFNLLGILGVSALVADGGLAIAPGIENFDLPVMVATALACLPLMLLGRRLGRIEGALFLLYYVAYTTYLVLSVREHAALPGYSKTMIEFVLPLTLITLIGLAARARGRLRADAERH